MSVVVRTRDESENILNALESLRAQTFRNYEVIIVDNKSGTSLGFFRKKLRFSWKHYWRRMRMVGRWISLGNSWFKKSVYLLSGGTTHYRKDVIADDHILALKMQEFGPIAYVKEAKVATENWLFQKPTWLSEVWDELKTEFFRDRE